jgi:hypothetical protein
MSYPRLFQAKMTNGEWVSLLAYSEKQARELYEERFPALTIKFLIHHDWEPYSYL